MKKFNLRFLLICSIALCMASVSQAQVIDIQISSLDGVPIDPPVKEITIGPSSVIGMDIIYDSEDSAPPLELLDSIVTAEGPGTLIVDELTWPYDEGFNAVIEYFPGKEYNIRTGSLDGMGDGILVDHVLLRCDGYGGVIVYVGPDNAAGGTTYLGGMLYDGLWGPGVIVGQAGLEFCDAPEDALAYPSTGVWGWFPTCVTVGPPASWVQHTSSGAWLGPTADFETDGDAGLCPPPGCFPTYDDDECYADGDAGLLFPEPYTIDPLLNVIPCPLSPTGTALGPVCQQAVWGQDIDIEVHNNMVSGMDAYVNVMLDWLQDGDWVDTALCGTVAVPEHVLQNWPIANGYNGPISGTMPFPTSFQIGPNPGYVWARVSITERQVPVPWDGSGAFQDGESEGYLIRVDGLDFGDAPDPCYPTFLASNGARHVIVPGPWMGDGNDAPDSEPDGQPVPPAAGDDLDGNDDENGLTLPTLTLGHSVTFNLQVSDSFSVGGQVEIWIDYNIDGDWDDAGELAYNAFLPTGNNLITINVPAAALPGMTFARGRISSAGIASPRGLASDGEVEDTEALIEEAELDFGDAPEPPYPTTLAVNGARHTIVTGGPFMGFSVDAEPDGQPDPNALGDDNDGNDDEDGVFFLTPLMPGTWAAVDVEASVDGFLDAWVDFGDDGSWAQPGDQIFASEPLVAGLNPLSFWVPFGAKVPATTYARFRFSSYGGLPYDGPATDGEVEDYEVYIEANPTIKWIQLPDTSPNGIDIKVDNLYWLADDFECTTYGPITDVHLWGSWMDDMVGEITRVHLSFHNDDPCGINGYSEPNELLWWRDFWPGEFQVEPVMWLPGCEWWWDPDETPLPEGDCQLWRIDIYIPAEWAFIQEGDPCNPVTYWLDVQVETEFGQFGWKTRRFPEHYKDDAVFDYGSELPRTWRELRYPPEHPYHANSIDMAFVLTAEEWEPPKPPVKHLKWSQPPIEINPALSRTPEYCGWNEQSLTTDPCNYWRVAADDFRCLGSMPVASVHWYGSHIYWSEPCLPPILPTSWRIGFWSNVPANPTADPCYSHPEKLLWQVEVPANRVHVDWVGWDWFPDMVLPEACFQYYVEFEPNEYFWQNHYVTRDKVYWISIAAIYPPPVDVEWPWGWKTRPAPWMDDAVVFEHWGPLEPGVVADPWMMAPIEDALVCGEPNSYDLAFELDTDPCYIKWEQAFTGIRNWRLYEDVVSMAAPFIETKWSQMPDPGGWDVARGSDAYDDWLCTETGPVSDIHFWYSWKDDAVTEVGSVEVWIYSDNPSGPGGHSEPNELLWSRGFPPGEFSSYWDGAGDQGWYDPLSGIVERPDHINYYKIDIDDINDPFIQTEGTIYWLNIWVNPQISTDCVPGWKTSLDHWNDVAVWYDFMSPRYRELYDPCTGETLDLAFEITTKKEYDLRAQVADDWRCDNNAPVTAAVWWGSYFGYEYEACMCPWLPAPVKPDYFELTIWDDVPDPNPFDPMDYSHPNNVIWKYKAYDYDEVLVGFDKHPLGWPREPVFRYSVRIPEDRWFCQEEPNEVYWFSVLAVYDGNMPNYDWGWTNHEYYYNDNAVTGKLEPDPDGTGEVLSWHEIFDQSGASADMSFMLFTEPDCFPRTDPKYNQWVLQGKPRAWCCKYQSLGDVTGDGASNIFDLFAFRTAYGTTWPNPGYDCRADLNHDGAVNIFDLFIFRANYGTLFEANYSCPWKDDCGPHPCP